MFIPNPRCEFSPPGSQIKQIPGSRIRIKEFKYFNRSSHKKQSLITTIMEVFSDIPREATKRACSPFRSRLEKVVAAKGDFIT
jgi:hypothetical protein